MPLPPSEFVEDMDEDLESIATPPTQLTPAPNSISATEVDEEETGMVVVVAVIEPPNKGLEVAFMAATAALKSCAF